MTEHRNILEIAEVLPYQCHTFSYISLLQLRLRLKHVINRRVPLVVAILLVIIAAGRWPRAGGTSFFSKVRSCPILLFFSGIPHAWRWAPGTSLGPGNRQPASWITAMFLMRSSLKPLCFRLNELLMTFTFQAGRCAIFFVWFWSPALRNQAVSHGLSKILGAEACPVNSRIIRFRPFIPLIASNIDNRQ